MITQFLMTLDALTEGTATYVCRPPNRNDEPPLAVLTITRAVWDDLEPRERAVQLVEMKETQ